MNKIVYVLSFQILFLIICSCTNRNESNQSKATTFHAKSSKPPSSFNDTFKIFQAAIVIYTPDSIQLDKIKSATDPKIYDGQMHEYEYQLKYSRKILDADWPQIPVFEPKNKRFLIFQTANGNRITIDLNKYNDPYGILLFNFKDGPVLADMTNFEQAVFQHFKN